MELKGRADLRRRSHLRLDDGYSMQRSLRHQVSANMFKMPSDPCSRRGGSTALHNEPHDAPQVDELERDFGEESKELSIRNNISRFDPIDANQWSCLLLSIAR